MKNIIKYLIFSFLIVTPIIIAHEMGHLIFGLLLSLNPQEFSIGFGNVLFDFDFYNINWNIRALPLGGFVRFSEDFLFTNKSYAFLTLLAGPIFNFIFAFKLFSLFFSKIQDSLFIYTYNQNLFLFDRIANKYYQYNKDNMTIHQVGFNPKNVENINSIPLNNIKNSLSLSFPLFFKIPDYIIFLVKYLKQNGLYQKRSFLGPVAIIKKGIHEYDKGVNYFLFYLAELSVGIGFLNLLPLPFLDGGKIWGLLEQTMGFPILLIFIMIFFIFKR